MSNTPFKEEKETMLGILQSAHDDIEAGILSVGAAQVKNNILRDLKKHINILSTHLKIDINNKHSLTGEKPERTPVTSIFGKKLVFKADSKAVAKSSNRIVEIETKQQSEELKNRFVLMSTEDILNNLDDEQIMGVASLVGILRDKDEKLPDFVDKIREAVKASIAKSPMEIAAEELKAEAEKLYPHFVGMEVSAILDSYSEPVIKFVAKMVNIPVGENLPKKVDAKFIATIKEAITRKADLEAKGNQ